MATHKYIQLFARLAGLERSLRSRGLIVPRDDSTVINRENIEKYFTRFNDDLGQSESGIKATDAIIALLQAQDDFVTFIQNRKVANPAEIESDMRSKLDNVNKTIKEQIYENNEIAKQYMDDSYSTPFMKKLKKILPWNSIKKRVQGDLNAQVTDVLDHYNFILANQKEQNKNDEKILEIYDELRGVAVETKALMNDLNKLIIDEQEAVNKVFSDMEKIYVALKAEEEAASAAGGSLTQDRVDALNEATINYEAAKKRKEDQQHCTAYARAFFPGFEASFNDMEGLMIAFASDLHINNLDLEQKSIKFASQKTIYSSAIVAVQQATTSLASQRATKQMNDATATTLELVKEARNEKNRVMVDVISNPADYTAQMTALADAAIQGFKDLEQATLIGHQKQMIIKKKSEETLEKIVVAHRNYRDNVLAVNLAALKDFDGQVPTINVVNEENKLKIETAPPETSIDRVIELQKAKQKTNGAVATATVTVPGSDGPK